MSEPNGRIGQNGAGPGADDDERIFGFDTLAVHAGQRPDPVTGARAMPIYQTTSYVFEDTDHAAELFALQRFGNIYTRIMNPTTAAFEERVAALEAGCRRAGHRLGTGRAVHRAGDPARARATRSSRRAPSTAAPTPSSTSRCGAGASTSSSSIRPIPENFRRAITPQTRVLYGETIGNPRIDVLDIAAVAEIAHEAGVPLMIDNTFATPYLCRPLEHGADIVVHSATKFIGGHGTAIGGDHRRVGPLPLGQRQLPWHDRAVAGLPRHPLLRDLRRVRLPDEGARREPARPRSGPQPLQRVPLPARAGDAAGAHGAAHAATRRQSPRSWPRIPPSAG